MKRKWWHDKVAYQIYPKSFLDTNGDGIGDLRGIISKLDYLKELGIDIIWLSPIYKSPFVDQGYDISDYYKIAEEFGTMEEFDELLAEAKKRDMYIVMDLVVNHCSSEHEYFKAALADPDGPYADYFYFVKGIDGKEPSNYRSYFGGKAWEPVPGSDKYYLHMFAKEQPDWNWENKEVRDKIYKMINWWLDKGLGGFRIDAIINIKKKFPFADYPVDRPDGLSSIQNMLKEATGIGEFLSEMQARTFDPHNAFSVGEVFDEKDEELPDFIGDGGYFSSMFDFSTTIFGGSPNGWYDRKTITPDDYKECCFHSQQRVGDIGYLSNIIENHDEPRGVSHYIPDGDLSLHSKKLLATMYFMLRGLPFIYQGQEIGMENMHFQSIDQVDDINTIDEYHVAKNAGLNEKEALSCISRYSRDNARTPVQWNDSANAGFTSGNPWLPLNPNYKEINVASQENDPDSLLSFYKELITLRKNPEYKETVVYGELIPYLEEQHNLMSYYRKGDKTLLVLGNFQKEPQTVKLPSACRKVLLNNYPELNVNNGSVILDDYQAVVIEL